MSVPFVEFEVGLRGLRRLSSVAGLLMLLQAMLLAGLLSIRGERVTLPITVDLPGGDTGERVELFQLDVGVGVVVLCVLVAVARLVLVIPAVGTRLAGRLRSNDHAARWTEFAFSSSITVFLVAQLYGISDIGALVVIYAITSGTTLFSVLQERTIRDSSVVHAQLRHALDSRVVIEQAKGVIAHTHGVDMDEAFRLIRREARDTSTAMPVVAAGIVEGRVTIRAAARP